MAKRSSAEPRPISSPNGTASMLAPSLTRRRFINLTGAATAAAALSGCGLAAKSTPSESSKVRLVYQDWRTDWFPAMAQGMLEEFQKTHPNIQVFFTMDPDNLEEKMLADLQSGTAADVFQGCCSVFPIWGQKGYLLDLRPFVKRDLDASVIDDWDPAQYKALFTPDGIQFGLPKYHGSLALYYNKDLFDKYRVDYPDASWTYDDYLAAMRQLKAAYGNQEMWASMFDVSWERIQVHANAWGGHFVDPADAHHSLMGEPEAVAALEWLRARIWDDRVMPSPLDVHNQWTWESFVAQKTAMVEDGSWALKDILAGAKFRVGVAPFPAGPVKRATLATTDGLGIYARSKNPEAAWELLKFLVSKEYGRAMARTHFLQPARASLVGDWIGYVQTQYPEQTKEMDLAAFADGHVKGYSVVAEVFAHQEEAQRLAYAAWDRILILGQSPSSLMAETSEAIQDAQ